MPVETSTKQMALLRNPEFMERTQAMLAMVTSSVLSEPGSTPYHSLRASYAQKVVASPQASAFQAGPQVVMGINVINATTYDEVNKTSICNIADIDLQSQIMFLWNSLGGIDTPA
jgi:hypothetical protein